MTNRNPEKDTVIHMPCGRDWTDYRGHHECRSTMDHRGLCVSRTSHGEHPSLIGNPGITLCPVEVVTAQIDKDDGTCWACGTSVLPPGVTLRKRKLTSSEKRMRDLSGIEVYEVTRVLPPGVDQ